MPSWPWKALALSVGCGVVSAAAYVVTDAAFSGSTPPRGVVVASLDPVLLVGSTADTTTFDVPDVSGAYPVIKCMPVEYSGADTPVDVRVWGAPAGSLDPELVVRVETGTSDDEYDCAAFRSEAIAYEGSWAAMYGAHTDYGTGVPAGVFGADGKRHAARVTFALANPGTPPAAGLMSRIALPFGARPCAEVVQEQCPVAASTYFLKTYGAPGAGTASFPFVPLNTAAPTWAGELPNYDTNRNNDPGLTLARGGVLSDWSDPTRYQVWLTPVLSSAVSFPGDAEISLWSAMRDFKKNDRGAVSVGLYDCPGVGTSCALLGSATINQDKWHDKEKSFVQKVWVMRAPIATVRAGRRLAVKVVVESAASNDMWFAYDTTALASTLEW